MPKIVLIGQELPEYNALNIDKTLTYMAKTAEENESFNRAICSLIKGVYQEYKNEGKPKAEREIRLQQVREFYCLANGLDRQYIPGVTVQIIESFIDGSGHDAERAKNLKDFIKELQKLPSIELPLLATFHYTLKVEFDRMNQIKHQSEPEKQMIEKLLLALEPLVMMSERSKFQRLYHFCDSFFMVKGNTDVNSKEVLEGNLGMIVFKRESFERYIVGLRKIASLHKQASAEELEALDRSWGSDAKYVFADKPSCYHLTVETYLHYPFRTMYLMADLYEKLRARKQVESEKPDPEWVALQQEVEKTIEDARVLSIRKKQIHFSTQKCVMEEQTLLQQESPKNRDLWLAMLKTLHKDHFSVLESLFSKSSNSNITLSQYSNMITALGGKVDTFDGSKTRILLSGEFFNLPRNIFQVTGGFDKPHKSSSPLHFVQKRLACKALERVGLTKQLIEESIELRQNKAAVFTA